MCRLERAVPAAQWIERYESDGRHYVSGLDGPDAAQAEVGRRDLEGEAVNQVKEHGRLSEHQHDAIRPEADALLESHERRQDQTELSDGRTTPTLPAGAAEL